MAPLLEVCTLVPNQASGAWLAHYRFILGSAEYDGFVFCGSLYESITVPQKLLATGAPLAAARHQFLRDVVLTVQH